MALALGEDRHEHVGTGDFLATRRLHMHHRAMNDALKALRRRRLRRRFHHQVVEFIVEEIRDPLAQLVEIDVARAHDRGRIAIIDKGEQQMLQRRRLVIALVGILERAMQCGFQAL